MGFEIEGIAFVVLAVIAIGDRFKLVSTTPEKIVFIIVAVLIQAMLPTLGHAAVLKVLRWLAIRSSSCSPYWPGSPLARSTCMCPRTGQAGER